MEETVLQKDLLSLAKKNMQAYVETHDVKYITEDAVFTHLGTGEVYKGKAEVGAMLHYLYHVAFDAHAEVRTLVVEEKRAVAEGFFKGRHVGDFAGIKATNKEVDVPLSVFYTLREGLISEARIYYMTDVLMRQLGVASQPVKVSYLVRDIFQLRFGQFKEVKALMKEAMESGILPEGKAARVLTDFTGDAYRLIMEEGFDSLNEYETKLSGGMATAEFQEWYKKFIPHVERSHREILKQIQ